MGTLCDVFAPFDDGPGKSIRESTWREIEKAKYRSGIIDMLDGFGVYADTTGEVKIRAGGALLAGHYAENAGVTTEELVAIGSPRLDRVVLRADYDARTISTFVITGNSPSVKPALTDDSHTFDIPLGIAALVSGSIPVIFDERNYACGIGGTIKGRSFNRPDGTNYAAPSPGDQFFELDTHRWRFWDDHADAWRWVGGQGVGAVLHANASASIGPSWCVPSGTNLMTGIWDPDVIHDDTGHKHYVTIPEDGTYSIILYSQWATSATGRRGLGFHKQYQTAYTASDPTVGPSHPLQFTGSDNTVSARMNAISEPIACIAGDVISMALFETAGGALGLLDARMSVLLLPAYQS
jgi:hypothetical protein